MRFIYLALIILSSLTVNSQNTPVFTKVTATWCPNCGNWGWEYMETMKDMFATGDAVVLGAHFSGDLANPTSEWFADNLNSVGQPKFYVNNERITVSSGNWSTKVQETVDAVATAKTQTFDVLGVSDVQIETINYLLMLI